MSIYLKNNIWHVYFTILGIGFAVLLALSCYLWDKKQEQYLFKQTTHIELLSNSFKVFFKGQEALLDTLGQQLANSRPAKKPRTSKTLDRVIQYNPDVAAMVLTDTKGNQRVISSNLKNSNALKIIKKEPYKSYFNNILKKEKIFIAKTTNFNKKDSDLFVIPLAKTIFGKNKKPIAVMLAGIHLENTLLENETIQLGDYHHVNILKENLDYLYTSANSIPDGKYPLERTEFNRLIHSHNTILKLSLTQLIKAALGMDVAQQQIVSKFDPYTELWFISYINNTHIIKDFSSNLIIALLLFGVFAFILYWSIRSLSEKEFENQQNLIQQTTHDALTSLPNGTFLRERFDSWINNRNEIAPFSVLYIDIDSFRSVNDSYGHEYGDRVLIKVAERLEKLRKKDELLVRQSGDEFIYLAKQINKRLLKELTDDILYSLSLPYNINNNNFLIGSYCY